MVIIDTLYLPADTIYISDTVELNEAETMQLEQHSLALDSIHWEQEQMTKALEKLDSVLIKKNSYF